MTAQITEQLGNLVIRKVDSDARQSDLIAQRIEALRTLQNAHNARCGAFLNEAQVRRDSLAQAITTMLDDALNKTTAEITDLHTAVHNDIEKIIRDLEQQQAEFASVNPPEPQSNASRFVSKFRG